jgi:hypothetical protein
MVAGGPRAFERRFQFLSYRLLLFAPKATTYHLFMSGTKSEDDITLVIIKVDGLD